MPEQTVIEPASVTLPAALARQIASWHRDYATEHPEAAHLHDEWADALTPWATIVDVEPEVTA